MRLRIGVQDPEDEVYRMTALRAFVPGSSSSLMRRVLLTMLPSGRWQGHDCVDVVISADVDSGEQYIEELAEGMSLALLPSRVSEGFRARRHAA